MERPLLKLPAPSRAVRSKKGSKYVPPKLHKPTKDSISNKFDPKFSRLASVMDREDEALALRDSPDEIAPERALVFEVSSSVQNFYKAVKKVEGLEFLLDEDIEIPPDEELYYLNKAGERDADEPVRGCLYMVMPDVRALQELVSLWERYKNDEDFPYGFAPWKNVFAHLRDLRQWSAQDRVPKETIEYWQDKLASSSTEPVRFEVELWYRSNSSSRSQAFQNLSTEVGRLGGRIVHSSQIEDIHYHAALIDLPAQRVQEIIDNRAIGLAILDEIMFIKPQSMAQFPAHEELLEIEGVAAPTSGATPDREPIIAIIDGVPIQNHGLLRDRIIVEDPDDLGARVPVVARSHGTAMASLILHGDRNTIESSLDERVLLHPVLEAHQSFNGEWYESTPADRLPIDMIYRAIRRIKEGEGEDAPIGQQVLIVNHSLGDSNRQFAGRISAWARLLDYLAYKYKILIVVSAGNVLSPLKLSHYGTITEFQDANPEERAGHILRSFDAQKSMRSLLSPAEAINVLTVGGWHNDNYTNAPPSVLAIDPFPINKTVNISSAVGLGHKRSIKPDIVFDGGRELVIPSSSPDGLYLSPAKAGENFGQRTAAPHPRGDLNHERRSAGTSNAAALTTRNASRIYRVLEQIAADNSDASIEEDYRAIVVKTLLMHSCSWDSHSEYISNIVGPSGTGTSARIQRNENVIRYFGNGYPNVSKALECAQNRATLFGAGRLKTDESDLYEFSLPPSLNGRREFRRLTMTASWLSPTNARHQNYRAASLEIMPAGDPKYSLGVGRVLHQPNHTAIVRGTTHHVVLEGEDAVPYVDEGRLKIAVACRATAGKSNEAAIYGIAVSIEVAESSTINVYQEVRTLVQPRQRTRTRT